MIDIIEKPVTDVIEKPVPMLATEKIEELYNDGSEITTTNIGGDTTKPTVSLNATQSIMLDNNGEYRYYGLKPNNYVSFNGELWRIINVANVKSSKEDATGSSRVRIIRADSIGDHSWDTDSDVDGTDTANNNWETSTLNTTLNGIYYNSTSGTCYLNGSSTTCDYASGTVKGLNSESRDLLDDAVWYLGGNSTSDLYADDYYTFERGTTVSTEGYPTSTVAKLGIMYPSDYAYAADLSKCTKTGLNYGTDTTNCRGTNWLYNCDSQSLISPDSGRSGDAFDVGWSGSVGTYTGSVYLVGGSVEYVDGVRPVAVLKPNVVITGGTGTSGDPYQLSL